MSASISGVLQFSINGTAIKSPMTISSNVGAWQELFIRAQHDRSEPVPEPLTLAIFGAGLAGVAGFATLRRHKKKA